MVKTLAIVGGGASGLAAAIAAGDRARERGQTLNIVIYESDERVGRSILATGNGRCNFSNARIDARAYYNAEFAADAFDALSAKFGANYVHGFFASLGLTWREEADGRLYPCANKASVVVDVLRAAAAAHGARESCSFHVAAIDAPQGMGKPFTLRMRDGVFKRAESVIVACGGRAVRALEAHEAPVLRPRPVLGALKVAPDDVPLVRELDNIRVRCAVSLMREQGAECAHVMTETGELMFRKYGVSGICVFDLSRFAWPGDVLRVDFLQVGDVRDAQELLVARHGLLSVRFGDRMTYADVLRGLLLPRVSEALLKSAGIRPDDVFEPDNAPHLAQLLVAYPLEVAGIANPDLCQVQRGGFSVEAFDSSTMQAKSTPGFFASGEALDVDGPCGGYNLHWAWASGLLAGRAAADGLLEGRGSW